MDMSNSEKKFFFFILLIKQIYNNLIKVHEVHLYSNFEHTETEFNSIISLLLSKYANLKSKSEYEKIMDDYYVNFISKVFYGLDSEQIKKFNYFDRKRIHEKPLDVSVDDFSKSSFSHFIMMYVANEVLVRVKNTDRKDVWSNLFEFSRQEYGVGVGISERQADFEELLLKRIKEFNSNA
jgi:hypothetical protein